MLSACYSETEQQNQFINIAKCCLELNNFVPIQQSYLSCTCLRVFRISSLSYLFRVARSQAIQRLGFVCPTKQRYISNENSIKIYQKPLKRIKRPTISTKCKIHPRNESFTREQSFYEQKSDFRKIYHYQLKILKF